MMLGEEKSLELAVRNIWPVQLELFPDVTADQKLQEAMRGVCAAAADLYMEAKDARMRKDAGWVLCMGVDYLASRKYRFDPRMLWFYRKAKEEGQG